MKQFLGRHGLNLLLLFIPAAAFLHYTHRSELWVFICSGVAIIPLAGWMGKATESLAARLGTGIGGFMNATFGNAAELIIAIMALRAGQIEVVKASITGSILGNILLVLGLSVLCGGLRFKQQRFNRTAASMSATLLALSAIGLLVPAVFHWVTGGLPQKESGLSLEIAIVLFITYLLGLVFSLHTHKNLYLGDHPEGHAEAGGHLSSTAGVLILLCATVLIAWMSELLVHAVEPAAESMGMTKIFVGVIVVAIIGNAAEHSTAVLVAFKNQMDLAFHIAVGSSLQIALLVAPLLVFLSYLFGTPMDLLFTGFEVITVVMAVGIVSLVALDGESNWMEGVLLIAVYIIFGLAFFFLPEAGPTPEAAR